MNTEMKKKKDFLLNNMKVRELNNQRHNHNKKSDTFIHSKSI